jgi:uncharacterized protein DUF742
VTSRDGPRPAGSGPADKRVPDPAKGRIRPYLNAPRPASVPAAEPAADRDPDPPERGERPRPFVLTSGRVDGVDPDICLETQVSVRPAPPPEAAPVESLAPELQSIIAMCAEPLSVAEISARIPLHLGVTKVLVGDLRANGYLDVHTTDVANPHDPETILRVIRGLRAIT